MPRRPALTFRSVSSAGLFAIALAIGAYVARPFQTASIAFDSQVAVLDFSRLLAGRHVEVFLSTTPKPLLTLIFGPLELLSHDWRTLAWATLIAFALAVVLSAELARRLGGTPAWAFVGAGLVGSGALLFDVGYALATPWALLGWAVAGLALTGQRPHYGLAGVALLLASLARLETLLIVATAGVVLLALEDGPIRRAVVARGPNPAPGPPPRRAWLVLIGLGALPVMGLHDLLIYGDPLFWSSVPARYSAITSRPILAVPDLLGWLVGRYVGLWPLTVLALAGVVRLGRLRAWPILVGLAAIGPGMAAFLVYLAARRIEVPDRYAAPIDLALILAAGFGTAWLLGLLTARLRSRSPASWPGVLPGLAAIALAVVATWPSGFLDGGLADSIHGSLALAADVDRMDPILAGIVDRSPGGRAWPATISLSPDGPSPARLLVPVGYRPRIAVDLDAPLTTVGQLLPNTIGAPGTIPAVGQVLVHDQHADGSYAAFRAYETTTRQTIDGVAVVPIAADPARGWWITEIQAAP